MKRTSQIEAQSTAASIDAPGHRDAGVLLHVTSLPGPYGVGDFGPSAYRWVDWLERAGQTWWQILPLGPPGAGYSPYQCTSALAGNPLLISPEMLVGDGLLPLNGQMRTASGSGPRRRSSDIDRVDYASATALRSALLSQAWERFRNGAAGRALREPYERFLADEAEWLDDYALFAALKEAHRHTSWTQWPVNVRKRDPAALREARAAVSELFERERFVQFLFFRQLEALKRYANERGVRLLGDLPIFISMESADVWTNPRLFILNRAGQPRCVAGVPPDCFSATGQRWGNPLYDWPAMQADRFAWWVARVRMALRQADLVRIDHFRGLAAYWRIPANHPTAERGRWVPAPGAELLSRLREALGGRLPFVAEDLGLITEDVTELRDRFGLPGMRVLQFAFDGGGSNPHQPHNHPHNMLAYTGTHDNDTTAGWYAGLSAQQKKTVRRYVPDVDRDPAWALMRQTWASPARTAIAPMQDLLSLGTKARMNIPGSAEDNWSWRMSERALTDELARRLLELTKDYGRERLAPPAPPPAPKRRGRARMVSR